MLQGATLMDRRCGVLPAWEECAASLPEVALHHRRDASPTGIPPPLCLYDAGKSSSSSSTCLSPRQVAGWADAVGSASVVVSLKDVMDAGSWSHSPMPSPTPSSAISSSSSLSSRRSSFTSESDLSESVDDEVAKLNNSNKKKADKKKGSKRSADNKGDNKILHHKVKGAVYGKEDGKRCLQAATFERMVQWIINKEIRLTERVNTPRASTLSSSADHPTTADGGGGEEPNTTTATPRAAARFEVEVSGVARAFIGAFRQHASTERLLSLLDEYFHNPPKRGKRTTPQEKQRNCVYFVGAWVEEAFRRDFYRCVRKAQPPANSTSLKRLLLLLTDMAESYPAEVNRVKLAMLRLTAKQLTSTLIQSAKEIPHPSPLSEERKGTGAGRPDILTWDLTELAEQMTLMESSMFLAIQPWEFHKLAWRRNETRRMTSPHIVAVVERFNMVSYWVSSSIVMCNDLKKRVTMVKKFIKLAELCRDLRNFSTLMAVLAGLNNSAVRRLKLTWQGVNDHMTQSLLALDTLMENKANYKHYRDFLLREEHTAAPVVPYLGIYLRDLTFIDEGNADRADDLINFEKLVMQGDIILQVAKWQRNGSYHFKPDAERQLSLTKLLVLPEDILYKKSEAIEPSSFHTSL